MEITAVSPSDAELGSLTDLSAAGYVAARPFKIADHEVRPGVVSFEASLPVDLPDGAFATFARLDSTTNEWMPVATTVGNDSRTITATPTGAQTPAESSPAFPVRTASLTDTHGGLAASLLDPAADVWTIVIGGLDGAVDSVGSAMQDAGATLTQITDAADEKWNALMADWGEDLTLGSQWVMRAARDLLGTGADTPDCAPDAEGAVPWVTETLLSDNAMIEGLGLEGGNAAVLICAGPDPDDASRLQVRAAANRSYGFPVRFADGTVPGSAGMDALDPSTSSLIGAGYSAIANGVDLIVNPGRFILPGQTYSFVVDEGTVRESQALTATGRIVEYPMPSFPQVLLSSFLGAAMEELDPEDFFGGAMGVFFLARDCDFTQWQAGAAWTELTNGISTCLEALDSDSLQNAASDVARSASGDSADRAAAFVEGGAEKARRVIGKLKWLALFAATQTITDYIGDVGTEDLSDIPAWFVNATLAAPPAARWEDVAGTWCGITYPSCLDIVLGTTTTEYGTSTIQFVDNRGDCFAGLGIDDPGSGANIVYCPAGAETPADVPGIEPGLPPADDTTEFDRVFMYQGYGTAAWFRDEDVEAVKAQ